LRPIVGILAELAALAALWWAGFLLPSGFVYLLYVILAELLSTYLVHCPAHYLVGRALGIRFVDMRLGRTTLAKALPPRFSKFARLMPIFTLRSEKESLLRAGAGRASVMYASGTLASVLSAFSVAAWTTPGAQVGLILATWGTAILYLVFDVVFSPRSGDIMRARKARIRSASEPVGAQK
jgi:hypothetical protein